MKVIKKVLITILIVPLLFISLCFIMPVINNITLHGFSQQLYNIDLLNTEVLEKHSVCGKLTGNGNGMDYLACVLVETDLSYEELKLQLEKTAFTQAKKGAPSAYGGKPHDSPVEIDAVKVDDRILHSRLLEHQTIKFGNPRNWDDYSKYYALVIADYGYDAGFDIRGH